MQPATEGSIQQPGSVLGGRGLGKEIRGENETRRDPETARDEAGQARALAPGPARIARRTLFQTDDGGSHRFLPAWAALPAQGGLGEQMGRDLHVEINGLELEFGPVPSFQYITKYHMVGDVSTIDLFNFFYFSGF